LSAASMIATASGLIEYKGLIVFWSRFFSLKLVRWRSATRRTLPFESSRR
jgi:hypothetical protein